MASMLISAFSNVAPFWNRNNPRYLRPLILLLSLLSIRRLYLRWRDRPLRNGAGRIVVISGADSGFGRGLALALDRLNFNVVATCLSDAGVNSLRGAASKRLTALKADITKPEDIEALRMLVLRKTSAETSGHLYALVNNAGIGASGYTDQMPLDTYRRIFDVNFFGHVAVTKAMLDFLLTPDSECHAGRVIYVTSIAGTFAGPSLGAYSASKFASEAFVDTVRREFRDFGLKVVSIQPSFFKTNIIEGAAKQTSDDWLTQPQNVKDRWGTEFHEYLTKRSSQVMSVAQDPQIVVDELVRALTSRHPPDRIRIGWMAKYWLAPVSLLPSELGDRLTRLLEYGRPAAASSKLFKK